MSFIDKYYAIFNNSVGQHSVTISRAEFANLLGVFSKQEQRLDQLKAENGKIKESRDYYKRIVDGCPEVCENGFCQIDLYNKKLSKTLTEIKEIAESRKYYPCSWCIYKEILQKISEVIPDEN